MINTPSPALAHAIYNATGIWFRELIQGVKYGSPWGINDDMPSVAKHYAATSKNGNELEIVAKYVITQAGSVST